MVGFPKYLNSRHDYEFIRQQFPEDVWRPRWQALLDSAYDWAPAGQLLDGEAGVTDESHRVVEIHDPVTGELKERWQYVSDIDSNAELFRLGFTVEEITAVMGA
jgi:hypothetical protein